MKEALPPEADVKASGFCVHACAEPAFPAPGMGAGLIGVLRGPFIADALCNRYALSAGDFPRPAERHAGCGAFLLAGRRNSLSPGIVLPVFFPPWGTRTDGFSFSG